MLPISVIHCLRGAKRITCHHRMLQNTYSNRTTTGNDDVIFYTKLTNRSLIRLKGAGVDTFLQGLVTNDVKGHFKSRPPNDSHYYSTVYAFMLNTQGRVLYDLLMYAHLDNGEEVLIECDRDVQSEFKKLLQTYRLRKKIDIDSIDQNFQTFCAYYNDVNRVEVKSIKERLSGAKASAPPGGSSDKTAAAIFCPDPRIPQLGCRVILPTSDATISSRVFSDLPEKPLAYYRRRRYTLGIGEGCQDLPVGNCFPLESNGDYLNGVSFHKGCYVGQELTARTHHTGVVRKRLMPLFFERASIKDNLELIKPDAKIFSSTAESQENLGKFRSGQDDTGLALLRVEEALKAPNKLLQVTTTDGQKFACTTEKPDWWLNNSAMAGEVHVNAQPAKA